MKKLFAGTLLAVMLAATPALAAQTAPVIFNGEALGDAHIGDGRTYLPFRVIFEACGATVDWDAATETVIAVQDGTVLTMQVGQKTADVGGEPYTLDTAPYVKNGRTYVPVRFVSETLGYDVEWDGVDRRVEITVPGLGYVDGDDIYTLNTKTGEITLWQGGQGKVVLGVCDLEKAGNYEISGLKVTKTAGGNYLAEVDIWTSGAMTMTAKLHTWMDAETGEQYTVNSGGHFGVSYAGETYETHTPKPLVGSDGCLWLCGINEEYKSEAYQIDDANGKLLKEWPIGDMLQEMTGDDAHKVAVVEWANDEYMLFSSADGLKWGLVSLADGKVTDLTDVLLTDEIITQMDDMVRPEIEPFLGEGRTYDDNVRNYFWQGIPSMPLIDPFVEMSFVKEENGVLHFLLAARMVDFNKALEIPIEYELK